MSCTNLFSEVGLRRALAKNGGNGWNEVIHNFPVTSGHCNVHEGRRQVTYDLQKEERESKPGRTS